MRALSPAFLIVAAGGLVIAASFGARSVFGIVLDPISAEHGWPREVFSVSIAIQNLVWGLAQPAFGRLADRFGDRRALALGFALYGAGMVLSAVSATPLAQHMAAGVLVGLGVAGTGFGIVLSLVGRAVPEERRAGAMATAAALGSGGQMVMPLLAGWLTEAFGWQAALLVVAALLIPAAALVPLMTPGARAEDADDPEIALWPLLKGAFSQGSYLLLTLGFFVCGFHVGFLTAHLPPYVAEVCGSVTLGAATLSIIGAANVAGTYLSGRVAQRVPKPYVLSGIYAARAVVLAAFLAVPPSPASVVLFSAAMGLFWLPTVPLTSALVATIFGARNLGMLYGFVFLSHQLGSFLGVWMGGRGR